MSFYTCKDCEAIFAVRIRNAKELIQYGDPTRFCPVCGSSDVESEKPEWGDDLEPVTAWESKESLGEYFDDEDSVDRY